MLAKRITEARPRIDRAPAWATFLMVLVPLLTVYLVSNEREHQNVDAITAALPAWEIATHGDVDLTRFADLPLPAIVESGGRTVSVVPPGTTFVAVPFYLAAGDELAGRLPSMVPAAVTGSVVTALAMAILHLGFRRLVSPSVAVVAALLAGLGTSTWTISSDQLWPHGPTQLWLATAVVATAARRHLASGLAFAAAVVTRPVTAVAAAATGLTLGWLHRHWKPVVLVGIGAATGVLGLSIYNQVVFDTFGPFTEHYGGWHIERAATRGPLWYLGNVIGSLVGPFHGFLVWSPFLLVLLPGLPRAWRAAPEWVRAAALGGAVYMLVHLWLNRQSGGLAYNYRYPLAMMTMAAPLLLLSCREWVAGAGERVKRYFAIAVVVSVGIQAAEAWVTHQSLFLLT